MRLVVPLLIFFLVCGKPAWAQGTAKTLKRAEDLRKNLSYAGAIEAYESLLKRPGDLNDRDLLRARLGLAEAYYFTRDNGNAERVYHDALQSLPVLKGDDLNAYKRFAQVLAAVGKYQDSRFFWEKYLEFNESDKRSRQFARLYARPEPLLRNQESYKVEYIGLNSGFPEFSPVYYKDGLVFVSGRTQNRSIKRVFSWDNSNFLDLYYVEDEKLLHKEEPSGAVLGVGGSNTSAYGTAGGRDALGKDYYTPPTSNDAVTIGHTGSEMISGSKGYREAPTVPSVGFSKKINSKYHEGPCVFYDKGNKIIFTRNAPPANSTLWSKIKGEEITRLKLFSAERKGKDWTNIQPLPFNSDAYSCGHPAISEDGRLLFFVSDMPGGFGGTDIYYVVFAHGRWGVPVNAGPRINSAGDELFPFLDRAGNLYYSSDGLPGLGSLDLFVARIDPVTHAVVSPVRNLGAPLNSQYDDFGILTDNERRTGYFSSNRKRGGSDDDIYRFTRTGPLYGCRDLVVLVRDAGDNRVLENVQFRYETGGSEARATTGKQGMAALCLEADQQFMFGFEQEGYESRSVAYSNSLSSDFEPDTLVVALKKAAAVLPGKDSVTVSRKEGRLINKWTVGHTTSFRAVVTDGNGTPLPGVRVRWISRCDGRVEEMMTRSDGTVEFTRDLECDYDLVSVKDGYAVSRDLIEKVVRKTFFGKKITRPVSASLFNSKLYKVGDVIRLENIYYAADDYKLNQAARSELTRLAEVMKKYPDMVIEVKSHTDSRGSALANQLLSDRRAKEVRNFLARFIDKDRIRAMGMGETEPLNKCGDGVQCTESEHARNRRTEFRVLRMEKI
ncbi:OmpA family protein [Leadbetterella sp. DM7]|uniref:OmpA family protein n=1 Tax=Leadbetterella sp. DM7 TaxID=3235085 RepID=UPI00349E742C